MAAVLTTDQINAFVSQDTSVVAKTLIDNSLVGTEVSDRVLAALRNEPERYDALVSALKRRGVWESF